MATKLAERKSRGVKGSNRSSRNNRRPITDEQRFDMISTAAYFIAERRGFDEGDPKEDWLEAESQFEESFELEK